MIALNLKTGQEIELSERSKFFALLAQIKVDVPEHLSQSFSPQNDTFLLYSDNCYLSGVIKDICGRRMIIRSISKNLDLFEILRSDKIRFIDFIAEKLSCDFIQCYASLLRINSRDFILPKSFFISNFKYSFSLPDHTSCHELPHGFEMIDFCDECLRDDAVLKELWTRWVYPGSTFFFKDTHKILNDEYEELFELSKTGFFNGLRFVNSNGTSFIFWLVLSKEELAKVAFIWVAPGHRGQSLGVKLLKAMALQLPDNIKSIDYIVSVNNTNSINMLMKADFTPELVCINKIVLKKDIR